MKANNALSIARTCLVLFAPLALSAMAQEISTDTTSETSEENSELHIQNTYIVQGYPAFSAKYSGPNSLPTGGMTRESASFDVMAGFRLWHGAEAYVDGMMWQGFGINNTLGIAAFPNGETFRLGTRFPAGTISRLFIRQTIGLDGEQETVGGDTLHLAGKRDISCVTLTLGRYSAKDIFDKNTYANDPRTQFLSWALMANQAWDYPADAIGYTTGLAAELDQPDWSLRFGLFQLPRVSNGLTWEDSYLKWPHDSSAGGDSILKAWGMVLEFERRYSVNEHPGVVRLLAYVNRAKMGSYQASVDSPIRPADVIATRSDDYRHKYGFGLNVEQELSKNVGVFSRLGWSDGQNEAWVFSDVDYTATAGVSVKGASWNRPGDTFGLAGIFSGISEVHQKYLQTGGTGILAGDGNLSYDWEKGVETYYDFQISKALHAALDYQFIANPAFNRDRGPVHVLSARIHLEF